jgi:hypothetical protein
MLTSSSYWEAVVASCEQFGKLSSHNSIDLRSQQVVLLLSPFYRF